MKPADTSTQGELRFNVPATSAGQGTLGIALTIRDNTILACTGFQSCKAIGHGGGTFAVTIQ